MLPNERVFGAFMSTHNTPFVFRVVLCIIMHNTSGTRTYVYTYIMCVGLWVLCYIVTVGRMKNICYRPKPSVLKKSSSHISHDFPMTLQMIDILFKYSKLYFQWALSNQNVPI